MMKSVLENLSHSVVGIDREGKIIIFNQSAEQLFNNTEGKVIGKKIWDIMEINDFTRTFISLVKESEPSTLEQVIPFPDNKIFLVKMFPVRNTDERVIGAIAILEDLTAMHKMEKTINDFVAMVSHELKTPLTSIKGFVETLLEGGLSNPQVTRRFLQVINEETNRMARLVIGLLDLTHIMREDKDVQELTPVNTTKVVKEAVNLFIHIAEEKRIDLKISIPDNLPSIRANEDKIRQVMINLVDNAIKYTSVKYTKTKKQGEVEVRAFPTTKSVHIMIRDTGVGIPKEECPKVFKKFYRVTSGEAAELGGTGLGLSITREIVHSFGGKIELESVSGEGTTFTVILPIA